ncbi:MAG: hypothetical protein HY040_17035 [Planctomycetes bacterium]|nr:hypothetical protein [Planctomycetota bacterium]
MRDFWPLFRHGGGPQPDSLHYAWDKAGLSFANEPIPWNAEAVCVHGTVHFPKQTPRSRTEFSLRLGGRKNDIPPESWTETGEPDSVRVSFRVPAPATTTLAELCWRERSLGQVTLPVIDEADFLAKLSLELPTVGVRLGDQTVACRTFVGSQCQGLVISAVLESGTSLAPILDCGLRVQLRRIHSHNARAHGASSPSSSSPSASWHSSDRDVVKCVPLHLSATQLASRQALVSASFPRPRRLGAWEIVWLADDMPLATHKIRAISKTQFQRSLRLASTRFVVQDGKGVLRMERILSEGKNICRAGPCFLISSTEQGMAGVCAFEVRALVKGAVQPPLLQEQEVLISDGPVPFVPGTLDMAELEQVRQFELRLGKQVLGVLPLAPASSATFNSEGGFVPADPFAWSPAAEEQLREKLGSLLEK